MCNIRLVEMTLTDLFNSTEAFHGRKVFASSGVGILEIKYYLMPENSLLVKSTMQGSQDTYTTIMKFSDVPLKKRTKISSSDRERGITELDVSQVKKKINLIEPVSSNVEVFCNCKSFYWSFNTQNARVDALYDKSNNIRTELPIGSPRGFSPNPTSVPGLCKHLIALAKHLSSPRARIIMPI